MQKQKKKMIKFKFNMNGNTQLIQLFFLAYFSLLTFLPSQSCSLRCPILSSLPNFLIIIEDKVYWIHILSVCLMLVWVLHILHKFLLSAISSFLLSLSASTFKVTCLLYFQFHLEVPTNIHIYHFTNKHFRRLPCIAVFSSFLPTKQHIFSLVFCPQHFHKHKSAIRLHDSIIYSWTMSYLTWFIISI